MSLPEISRRCLSCGAAVRAGARFCPQCGEPFSEEAEAQGAEAPRAAVPPTGEHARPAASQPPATKDWTPPTKESAASGPMPAPAAAEPAPPPVGEPAAASEEAAPAAADANEAGRAGDLRGRVARVREGTKARVGRMREEAIVVLEETPDDSGLRFVVVAAALFILSLVLLFLSTTFLR
ncbi:MAG: zinc ribbon domain-containing protein [Acidobacteria bacterium]|nr:zinc ribbon domain-containing protein [Acidobacteriota bacterium]